MTESSGASDDGGDGEHVYSGGGEDPDFDGFLAATRISLLELIASAMGKPVAEQNVGDIVELIIIDEPDTEIG